MFKWTTTTIINSNEDFSVKGSPLFSGQSATTTESGKEIPTNFFVKRVNKFLKPNVKAIYVRRHNDAEVAQVNIDLSNIEDPGVYRIALYVSLQGSNNSYYANDLEAKGKPFFIEFEKTEKTGTMTLAEKVVKIAKKYMQMVYENPLINVTNTGNTLVLTGTDEYQRFTMVELQKFDTEAGLHQSCCSSVGDFVTIDTIDENSSKYMGNITWGDSKGKEGFGTYRQLIKDLRLPTAENRSWGGTMADEAPIVNATYDQYIIHYCSKIGVQGLAYVGDTVQSATTHVFFVNTSLKNDWEAAISNIGDLIEVEDGTYTREPDDEEPKKEETNNDADKLNATIQDLEARIAALEA